MKYKIKDNRGAGLHRCTLSGAFQGFRFFKGNCTYGDTRRFCGIYLYERKAHLFCKQEGVHFLECIRQIRDQDCLHGGNSHGA